MTSLFRVTMLQDTCGYRKPHYPSYTVSEWNIGTASSLENAEKMISEALDSLSNLSIHSFRIDELPMDQICPFGECLSSYLYDGDGKRIDQRLYSTIRDNLGTYPGRTPEEMRFKEGDIVEVCNGDSMTLGVVIGLPVSREKAALINSNSRGLHLDDSDDIYTILFGPDCIAHDHVGTFAVFKPGFKMHPGVERRLRKLYNDYLTYPNIWEISNTTGEKRLDDILKEMNVEGKVIPPRFEDDGFEIDLFIDGKDTKVFIPADKVYDHIERVKASLLRIVGITADTRGYAVSKGEQEGKQTLTIAPYILKEKGKRKKRKNGKV